MFENIERESVHKEQSWGGRGAFELEIIVGATKLPFMKSKEIRDAVHKASDLIKDAVQSSIIAADPEAAEIAASRKKGLLSLFPAPIFVEEIPNEYCKLSCCRHLPWFVVTTTVGRITIGWRKRVICIDWEGTVDTATADELFPEEGVTKHGKMIHANSYEDAGKYINAIMESPNEW